MCVCVKKFGECLGSEFDAGDFVVGVCECVCGTVWSVFGGVSVQQVAL